MASETKNVTVHRGTISIGNIVTSSDSTLKDLIETVLGRLDVTITDKDNKYWIIMTTSNGRMIKAIRVVPASQEDSSVGKLSLAHLGQIELNRAANHKWVVEGQIRTAQDIPYIGIDHIYWLVTGEVDSHIDNLINIHRNMVWHQAKFSQNRDLETKAEVTTERAHYTSEFNTFLQWCEQHQEEITVPRKILIETPTVTPVPISMVPIFQPPIQPPIKTLISIDGGENPQTFSPIPTPQSTVIKIAGSEGSSSSRDLPISALSPPSTVVSPSTQKSPEDETALPPIYSIVGLPTISPTMALPVTAPIMALPVPAPVLAAPILAPTLIVKPILKLVPPISINPVQQGTFVGQTLSMMTSPAMTDPKPLAVLSSSLKMPPLALPPIKSSSATLSQQAAVRQSLTSPLPPIKKN